MQDWNMTDQIARPENAGPENDGPNSRDWKMQGGKMSDQIIK